jgi:hypothetical protein
MRAILAVVLFAFSVAAVPTQACNYVVLWLVAGNAKQPDSTHESIQACEKEAREVREFYRNKPGDLKPLTICLPQGQRP